MRTLHIIAGTIYASVALAGCATTTEDPPPDTTPTTVAQTTTTPDLPDVTFDACDKIDDAFLRRFELDPASREPNDFSIGREDIRACGYVSYSRSLSVWGQNTPWDNIPFTTTPQPLTINGRETLFAPGELGENSCVVVMRTDFGAVVVEQTAIRGGDVDPNMDPCDNIMEIAEAVEPLIDAS